MAMIHMTINGQKVAVEDGSTILEAARKLKIRIPTLCNLDLHDIRMVNRGASCRVCVVEVEGRKNLAPSCSTPAVDGMVVTTNSLRCIQARRTIIELFLSNHPKDCLVCEKNLGCELQALAAEYHIRAIKYKGERAKHPIDVSSRAIIRNMDKCIMCRRCETMCNEVQTVNVLSAINRGFDTYIAASMNMTMNESTCVFCGQCVMVCPTAALTEVSHIDNVWNALNDKGKFVVVQTAPAVRVALGEEFGAKPGTIVTGKMVAALRRLGFDKVFDTDFAADLTVMEESTEFIHRLRDGGKLPILTSCCPGWVKFFEHQFNDMLDIPSTSKSPHEMFGAIAKSYYAEKMGINPQDICVVSIMPCLAKKYEAARPELSNDGMQNVDEVITTRELARMLKEANIDLMDLEEEDFDNPLGESTGASVIFGTTGGVIEAVLRTTYEWLTNKTLKKLEFNDLRGFDGVKEAVIKVNDIELKIAVAHGLGNARVLLENIRQGKVDYHGIEIMACPGGCIGGGGQPYHHGDIDVIKRRMDGIYEVDKDKKLRKSNENPYIQKLYKEYLGEPYGEKAHELLHTHYEKRKKM